MRLSAVSLTALSLMAGAMGALDLDTRTPIGLIVEATARSLAALAAAGWPTSDGGRDVTARETSDLLSDLRTDLDYAAAHIPDDAAHLDVPAWLPLLVAGAAIWIPDDGPGAPIRTMLRAIADESRDGEISADDLRRILDVARAAIASARA